MVIMMMMIGNSAANVLKRQPKLQSESRFVSELVFGRFFTCSPNGQEICLTLA